MTAPTARTRLPDVRSRIPRIVTAIAVVATVMALGVNLVMAVLSWRSPGAWAGLVLATAGLVLAFRKPRLALIATALAPIAVGLLGWIPTLTWSVACFIGLVITLRGVSAIVVAPVLAVANLVGVWRVTGAINPTVNAEASIAAFLAVTFVAIGSSLRNNHDYRLELEHRAQDAITSRDEAIRLGVAEERVRIARDLHDGVGHQVAVLSMHLGTAEAKLATDTAMATRALADARTDVQTLLRETQSILRLLKSDDEPDLAGPTADHHNLTTLVQGFRDAGLDIEATLPDLDQLAMGPAASSAAYRIVQEGLTNATRHGYGMVTLRIDPRPGWVAIEIVNASRTPSSNGSGHGLLGMRARAEAAGGRLEVLPTPKSFRVTAELPLGGAE